MSHVGRFGEYAAAFEKVFASDDWSLLEPYFTEDAVYEIQAAPPFGGTHRGRNAVFAELKRSLDSFDRRFDAREVTVVEGPFDRDDGVWMHWRATYRRAGTPDLVMEGEETAEFTGHRIHRLEDRFLPDSIQSVQAWMESHAGKLEPAP